MSPPTARALGSRGHEKCSHIDRYATDGGSVMMECSCTLCPDSDDRPVLKVAALSWCFHQQDVNGE